jgi:hypothetical protein
VGAAQSSPVRHKKSCAASIAKAFPKGILRVLSAAPRILEK